MRKKGRTIAACVFATVWWGIFYPELCFTEATCEIMAGEEAQSGEIVAGEIWDSSGEELVIGSRLLEWCEENLFAGKAGSEK